MDLIKLSCLRISKNENRPCIAVTGLAVSIILVFVLRRTEGPHRHTQTDLNVMGHGGLEGSNTTVENISSALFSIIMSVVLWWNMDRNEWGLRRPRQTRGLPRSKWITNKWISGSHSQMFRRPCPSYSNREIRPLRERGKFQRGGHFTEP